MITTQLPETYIALRVITQDGELVSEVTYPDEYAAYDDLDAAAQEEGTIAQVILDDRILAETEL